MKEIYDANTIGKFLKDDKYYRIDELIKIDKILKRYPGIRLGIDGRWGSGKTVVAKMMYYTSNNKFINGEMEICNEKLDYLLESKIIYFDASKEDIFEEPLLSLAKVISEELDLTSAFEKHKIFEGILGLLKFIPGIEQMAKIRECIKKQER